MKTCAPALAKAIDRFPGGGAIINNLSMSSYMANATNIGYHVSKAAARMLTLCGAVEFGPKKIRVNSVHPALTVTPLIKDALRQLCPGGHVAIRGSCGSGACKHEPTANVEPARRYRPRVC